jgi:hypothetical protein
MNSVELETGGTEFSDNVHGKVQLHVNTGIEMVV